MADNSYNQSEVAYESGPKEVNEHKGMPNSKQQFGKANKMPQENKGYKQKSYPVNPKAKEVATKSYVNKVMAHHNATMHRHKEHR